MIQQSHSWAYTGENIIQKDTCMPMFIAELFATTKTQKEMACT